MGNKKCVLCEVEGNDVKARYVIRLNGDKIPVCQKHKELIGEDNILEVFDEQHCK